ncbi:MAG TPA: transcriptional regulator [Candidatus Saccharimonadales bacterium]|nr:transcriptional regulator [Candidatus Saccharimonadales bacterium]
MFEQLFGSKTRVKLLELFYSNPNRSFYVREITRKVNEQINSVRRELANLLGIGIISSESNNNRLYYEVNQNYEHYKALSMVFGPKPKKATKAGADKQSSDKAEPDVSIEHPLARDIKGVGKVELALLTGQFTRDDRSGVDLLIVGDINQSKLVKFISQLEKEENKEVRYTALPVNNYKYRLQINDRFIGNVLAAKKQVIINNQALPTES